MTLQGQHCIAHFKYTEDSAVHIGNIGGFKFPHGIDAYSSQIGVTNYGDNSFELFNNISDMSKH